MKIPLNKQKVLKVLLITIFLLLLSYFAWNMSLKVRNHFISQGYSVAINELVTIAENSQCQPFPVFFNERSVQLLNVECLRQAEEVTPETGEENQQQ